MSESISLNGVVDEKSGGSNTTTDIISTLPESIAIRILSLLPTKEAVRTSVLSKDWEHKWTNMDDIDIDDTELFTFSTTRKQSFCNFVDRILCLCPIKRFRLKCSQKYDQYRMEKWISNVVRKNVESIEMKNVVRKNVKSIEMTCDRSDIDVPRCLIHSASLKNLKLELCCTFRIPGTNCFSNLTNLYLVKARIVNELFPKYRQLIFTFPVLESLELEDCEWLNLDLVEINAPALKIFKSWCRVEANKLIYQVKICGAALASFEAGGLHLEDIVLRESSVSYAAIGDEKGFYIIDRHNGLQARMLLEGFSGLKNLKIYSWIFEALSRTERELPLPVFDGLKQLELGTGDSIDAFLELLYAAPSLEILILDVERLHNRGQYDLDSIPPCFVSHLKEVGFKHFRGYPMQVHLADYILKNALHLKKMSGLVRKKAEENLDGNSFWALLKSTFEIGDFDLGKDIKSMADFEKVFGEKDI